MNIVKFLRTRILKYICERLLLNQLNKLVRMNFAIQNQIMVNVHQNYWNLLICLQIDIKNISTDNY